MMESMFWTTFSGAVNFSSWASISSVESLEAMLEPNGSSEAGVGAGIGAGVGFGIFAAAGVGLEGLVGSMVEVGAVVGVGVRGRVGGNRSMVGDCSR